MNLFKRKTKDEEPVDLEARSPKTRSQVQGHRAPRTADAAGRRPDPAASRPVLPVLREPGGRRGAAPEARTSGYSCEVRDPLPTYPDQWSLVCERPDAVLDIVGVRQADDLFQGIADRHGGEFDGWEAAV